MVFIGSTQLSEALSLSTTPEDLIGRLFGDPRKFQGRRVRVLVFDNAKKAANSGQQNRNVALERKRLEEDKALKLTTGCEVLSNLSFNLHCTQEDCILTVVRATKSVAEAETTKSYVDGDIDWFPKKSGPPVGIAKNESHLGLFQLWQKHLMQITKRLGIEQAKVIVDDPRFSSPKNLFQTYEDNPSGEQLLQHKQIRPSGSSKDVQSLGSGQSIGPDTSKKVYAMFTSMDGHSFL